MKYFFLIFNLLAIYSNKAQQNNSFSVYRTLYIQEQGLPSSDVICGVEDQKGFLWFGLRNGLCRFDGRDFISIPLPEGYLKTWRIESMVTDDRNGIVLTYSNPVRVQGRRKRYVINADTYETKPIAEYFVNMPFADTSINSVYKTSDNTLGFFVANPNKIWHHTWRDGFKEKYQSNIAFKKWRCRSFNASRVIDCKEFFFIYWNSDKSLLLHKTSAEVLPKGGLSIIGTEKNGDRILVSDTVGKKINTAFRLSKSGYLSGYPISEIHKLNYKNFIFTGARSCDNDGTAILLHNNGPSLLSGTEFGTVDVFENNLVGTYIPAIYSYFKDRNGVYWICTGKGLVKLKITKNRFSKHYNQSETFHTENHSVRGLYADEKHLYANLFDMCVIQSSNDTSYIKKTHNYGLLHTDTGLWLGAFEVYFHDFKTKKTLKKHISKSNEIWCFLPLDKNRLLLGCTANIDIYDITNDSITSCRNNNFPQPTLVYKIFKTPENEIWAVADNGLFILSSAGVIKDFYGAAAKDKSHQFPFHSLYDIYFDEDKTCWIGTNGMGLCKWNRNVHSFEYFDITSGFHSNVIYGIQEDDFGNLWLSTDYGIVKLHKSTRFIKNFTIKDGITDNEFNRSSQFKSKGGIIYFGGVNGIVSFDPKVFAADTAKTNYGFYLTSCQRFNNITNKLEDVTNQVAGTQKLIVSPVIDYFTISFSLLNYSDGLYQYAYKIEGLDDAWNYISDNKLRFSNLPYGKYRLVVKAKTTEGYWNSQQIDIELEVETPFYKKWWFIILVFIVVISLVAALFYLRFRQRLKFLDRMNLLRVKLASDLHDEVGGLLNKSAMQSEMAKAIANDETKPLMDKIANNIRQAMSSMRDIMWNLDARNDSMEHLLDRVREYAQNMLDGHYDYTLDIKNMEDIHLMPEKRQAIYLIVKESINNIVKHSKAGRVKISLVQQQNQIHLSVFNESHFTKNEFSNGQGLKNMQMRAEKVKGSFNLNLERGVEISVKIPL